MRMNSRHPFFSVLAILICLPLLIPADLAAQTAQPDHAGKITAVLPIVNLIRGTQQSAASTSEEVFWGDVLNTGHLARARVALDDGSVLSVGSDTNLAISQHDATNQQTDLDLNYGRVRARAAALVKPNAHFRVRTPVGVAGVVGTEIAVIFDPSVGTMQVVCLEGTCQICDGAGNCVTLKGGQQSSVHGNQAPSQPTPATPMNVTDAVNSTNATGATGLGGGLGAAGVTAVGVGAAAAAAVATVVVRSVSKTPTCPAPTAAEAAHVVPEASCAARSRSAIGRAPGQRP
jgi:FecR-like protein